MRNEVQVNIKDLVFYILKKWKCIILFALAGCMFVSIFYGINMAKNNKQASKVETTEETLDSLYNRLSEEERVTVQQALNIYRTNEQNYNSFKEYVSKSWRFQIDGNSTPTYRLMYSLQGKQLGDNSVIEDEIFLLIRNWIRSEAVAKKISEELQLDLDASYIQEILAMEYTAGYNWFSLVVVAPDKEQCEAVKNVLKQLFTEKIQELQNVYSDIQIKYLSEEYCVEVNDSIRANQLSYHQRLNSLKSILATYKFELNANQQKYYDILLRKNLNVGESNETIIQQPNTNVAEQPLFDIKISLLGAIAGVVIAILALLMRYLLTDTLKIKEDISETLHQYVFGEADAKSLEKELPMMIEDIKYSAKKSSVSRLLLAGTYTDEAVELLKENIKKSLEKEFDKIEIDVIAKENAKVLRTINEADGIVCVEKIRKSTYKNIEKEIDLCNHYHIPVMGFIVIR